MKDLVINHNGQPCTTSRLVAGKFGKEHKNVLQAIEKLECSEEFTELNFQLSEYKDLTGRKLPQYVITRDGFSFLVMGFTGKEAARFKEEFIKAFNAMEAMLKRLTPSELSRMDILRMALESEQERIKLQKENEMLRPKAGLMDKVLDADEKIDIGQAAKILELPYGRNTLFKILRERGIFFRNKNEPRQEYVSRGYFVVKEKFIERSAHEGFMVLKILVTQKGLSFLSKLLEVVEGRKEMAVIV